MARRRAKQPAHGGFVFRRRLGVGLCVAAAVVPAFAAPSANDAATVLERHCFQCHGETATAGINLKSLISEGTVGDDYQKWEKVIDVLEEGAMPPAGLPAPEENQRRAVVSWVRSELNSFIERRAGDPGPVTVRRLTSAEYGYTIEDLTGLKLDVSRDFAGDAVGGEGFTNFGDVQFMHDAGLERYLEAAKRVADHAVIGAGPLVFYQDPGMTGFEMSAIHRIHDIYRRHGFRAVAAEGGRAFGLEMYGKAFFAAWKHRRREALGAGGESLAELAARENVSPKFLRHIWDELHQADLAYPTSEVVTRWRNLPAPNGPDDAAALDAARKGATELQQFVINWPRWLYGAGELAAGGAGDERALVITDATLTAETSAKLRFRERLRDRGRATVHISALPVSPAMTAEAHVIWRNPTVRAGRAGRPDSAGRPLREMLDPATVERIGFGRGPRGLELGPNDFALASGDSISFEIPVPDNARGLGLSVDAELAGGTANGAVLRLLISETADGDSGSPAWALLADPSDPGFARWKKNVLDYAASFPQTSHGEPTPSDRDAIPEMFDNTYNQPERDWFHVRVKYFRDDDFLAEKILDDEVRERLEEAWSDLMSSFDYHDTLLGFADRKFELGLGDKKVADLSDEDVAALPAEPRGHVERIRRQYREVVQEQREARERHLKEAAAFASKAWRRPLSAAEERDLRSFYANVKSEMELDHRGALRAVIARVLISPAFLYRLEESPSTAGAEPVSDWEMASRLSHFLWSSLPDEELRRAAAAGELSDPERIAAQVRRMTADPKARRLATEFFGQWLGFYRFDQHRGVDAERFPEFTDKVRAAMYDEAISFFEYIVRRDRPAREFLFADYTFVNQDLAEHYGLPIKLSATDEVVKISGVGAFQRGGAPRLGAVLTATSAPLRTSPVKRGDWLLRRILGTPTPPPPPDAGSLPGDDKLFGEMTVFERLEQHKRNATCAACHTRIDPLGFPLERFDAVGRLRAAYDNGKPIHVSGTLRNGTEISGLDGLFDYLKANETQVYRNLSRKLLGYALGRTVLASDLPLIDKLTRTAADGAFADLLSAVATSPQFRNRRGAADGTSPEATPVPRRTAANQPKEAGTR